MRQLPVADPGVPDSTSATRFLWWLVRRQSGTVAMGMVFGIIWMVAQAFMPYAIGRAIDRGVAARDLNQLWIWAGILMALGIVQAVAGVMRHRTAVSNFLQSSYRTIQVTVRHSTDLGGTLSRHLATGEVVSIGTSDISQIGGGLDITARGSGAVVAIITVMVILLSASMPLGLIVAIGVPILVTIVSLLIRPLHSRQQDYRSRQGSLTTRAGDIVTGLRVLRGVGGEATFAARYDEHSQELRSSGVRVARVESYLESAQFLLPGIFVVLVTWIGARFAVDGQISPGQLVAFYGYASFLVFPLRTLTEAVDKITRSHVAAKRVVRMLSIESDLPEPLVSASAPSPYGELVDAESGVAIPPGRLVAIATAEPRDAVAITDRLGRYVDGPVTLSGVPLRDLKRATVRELILVADNDARLFSGPMRAELAAGRQSGAAPTDDELRSALTAASADDILDALPDGLDTPIAERGREFSGGQQQRLRLARALLTNAPITILVEPTSAVDAHTEARIASRLRAARAGRTTVITSTSPLMLDHADRVIYVEDGKVVAEGTHRELLESEPRYVATVTRGES